MRITRAPRELKDRARSLRKDSTEAEAILWQHLRRRSLDGLKFHRQRPIGSYIVDFYCAEAGLVVEVDGEYHREPEQVLQDEMRTRYLTGCGLVVMRFDNTRVFDDIEAVLAAIRKASPSP